MPFEHRDPSDRGGVPVVVCALALASGCAPPPEPATPPPTVQPSLAEPAPSVVPPTPVIHPAPTPATIAWEHGVAALERARGGARPSMVLFEADWSASSVALGRRLEETEEVRRAALRVVTVRVDLTETSDEREALAARYEVDHVPTILVFDDRGDEAVRLEGEITTEALVDALGQVIR